MGFYEKPSETITARKEYPHLVCSARHHNFRLALPIIFFSAQYKCMLSLGCSFRHPLPVHTDTQIRRLRIFTLGVSESWQFAMDGAYRSHRGDSCRIGVAFDPGSKSKSMYPDQHAHVSRVAIDIFNGSLRTSLLSTQSSPPFKRDWRTRLGKQTYFSDHQHSNSQS